MSSDKNYMIQLDGLRTIAVGIVMFGHWVVMIACLAFIARFGASVGVDMFFVLSGFLITSILITTKEKSPGSRGFILKQFYIRRFLRIFPLYYLVIVLGVYLNIPTGRRDLVYFLTYTANWLTGFNGGACGAFTHLWSLCVEEQFYIVFPFLFLIISKKYTKRFFTAMIVLAVFVRIVLFIFLHRLDTIYWIDYSLTPCCLDAFGIGALLAFFKFYYAEKTKAVLTRKYIWIVPFLLLLITCFVDSNRTHLFYNMISCSFGRLFQSIFSVWVVGMASYSAFKGAPKRFLENKIVVYLGKISYGLYVYHHFMTYFDKDLYAPFHSFTLNFILSRFLLLIITVGIASISWFLFERPINNLKRYFSYTSKQDKPGVAIASRPL